MKLAVAAAGTGGHIFPALAVAEQLVAHGTAPEDIIFFGGDRLEASVVPEAGFDLVQVEIQGLRRRVSLDNIRLLRQVASAQQRFRSVIKEREIRAVLAMGGYVTGPAALAARRARIPLVLHEQNAVPGLANRLAARFATRILVGFPAAVSRLPGAKVVGNPIREAFGAHVPSAPTARTAYGLDPSRPVVGIMGGSQGADALNHAAAVLAGFPEFQLLHLAGPDQAGEWIEASEDREDWVVIAFESRMERFYAAADVVVARAGALTVSELAATGTPSVLVPLQGPGAHQGANAEFLVEAGAGELLDQHDLAMLPEVIMKILTPSELRRRAAAAAALGRPGAAAEVARQLIEVARG